MAIVLEQNIKSTILVSGSYNNPNAVMLPNPMGGAALIANDPNSPALYDAHGARMVAGGVGGVGAHYRMHAGVAYTAVLMPHAQSGGKLIGFRPDDRTSNKRCVYLPYCDNYICSTILPRTVKNFFTDNLSGCAVYIAEAPATGDLILFHANARRVQGTQGDAIATTLMRNMVRAAIVDYRGWLHQAVTYKGGVEKSTYLTQSVATYTARKTGEGRTGISSMGEGTNVIGVQKSGRWKFYYQTWALVDYTRHGAAAFFHGATRTSALGQGQILDAQAFWHE